MLTLIVQAVGCVAFGVSTIVLGRNLSQHRDRITAKELIQTNRSLFQICLLVPGGGGLLYPGLHRYDALLGLPSPPYGIVTIGLGSILLLSGMLILLQSYRQAPRPAEPSIVPFTFRMRRTGIYRRVRHPRSLGGVLACIGIAVLSGSAAALAFVLVGLIPVHVLNLLYVRERALSAIYGSSYDAYRRHVPFLVPAPEKSLR